MNNPKNTSVAEALKKGVKWINVPSYILMFSFFLIIPGILLYVFREDNNNIFLAIGGVSSILLAIILPFLWYFIMVVKYKIWASNNVKDIHRFYNEAITKKIINESDFFRKFEVKNKNQKRQLDKFYERLKSERTIVRDKNIEIENETFFKSNHGFNIFLYVAIVVFSIYLYFTDIKNTRNAILFGVLSIGLIIYEVYKKSKYGYILKINNNYISYKDDEIKIYWKDIMKFDSSVNHGSFTGKYNAKFYLNILTKEKNYNLELEGIHKIGVNKIMTVLNENKHRFDIKNQSSL